MIEFAGSRPGLLGAVPSGGVDSLSPKFKKLLQLSRSRSSSDCMLAAMLFMSSGLIGDVPSSGESGFMDCPPAMV